MIYLILLFKYILYLNIILIDLLMSKKKEIKIKYCFVVDSAKLRACATRFGWYFPS